MRIAQVAPLFESVPPRGYGGTERVVFHLTEELVHLGHEVTLFASGDSATSARLVPCAPHALRGDPETAAADAIHLLMIEEVFRRRSAFDLLHFHIDYQHFPLARCSGVPSLTTLHNRLDSRDRGLLLREYRDLPLVSISDAQRRPVPWARWEGTVHHGLPESRYPFHPQPEDYLVFLGRLSRDKRPDRAIRIALQAGLPLKIAAKVGARDRAYVEGELAALLRQPGVEFLGEVSDREKGGLLGGARALLFPIDWPEPFGLVLIEALACGTPVIAWPLGAVPEVIEDGVTGFLVESEREAVAACARLGALSRRRCREEFERRFSARRMAQDYLRLYRRLAAQPLAAPRAQPLGEAAHD